VTFSFITGYALGFSLILAIGAQNAFVLRQGIRRAHVLPVVLTCAISDAIFIAVGVAGFGVLVEQLPWLVPVTRIGGAAFLIAYGILSMRSAITGSSALKAASGDPGPLLPTLLVCLALSWGNPHVYLDTLVLIGSVATAHDGHRVAFGAGAITASFVFFFCLGYGARLLAPYFAKPSAWRALDAAVAFLMWGIAASLLL
jgi:L-lysine exporter family protein LysE/ArgO